ncbi:MAG: hypothetical protein H6839_02180 [Planctomycetes bacterium]|nr:hypothetical protein [Planctomycetota bacterium]
MTIQVYQPTGRFSPLVFFIVPLFGLAGGFATAWLYALLVDWIPYIVLSIGLTVVFGLGLGLIAAFGLRLGKCRNHKLAMGLGAMVGILGLAASYYWAFQFVKADVEKDPMFAEQGLTIGFTDYLDARVETGWQVTSGRGSGTGPGMSEEKGLNFSGVMVYIVWLIEAAIVIGAAAVAPLGLVTRPYCEGCDGWARRTKLGTIGSVHGNQLSNAARAGDWQGIVRPAIDRSSQVRAEVTLYSCPAGNEPMYVTITLKWTEKNGRRKEAKSEDLLRYWVIEPAMVEELKRSIAAAGSPQRVQA